MSRDCLCLMLALCCQDLSSLGRGGSCSVFVWVECWPLVVKLRCFLASYLS